MNLGLTRKRQVTLCGLMFASMMLGTPTYSIEAQAVRQSGITRVKRLTAEPEHLRVMRNRIPLAASKFYPLPMTLIKPRGWFRRQLRIQADGLSGHLDEFWPDVGPNSGWLGGSGESWERGPYYLDGLVPLAYLLDDPKLIAKARKWVNWTLNNQRPNGSIGPAKNTDWWPKSSSHRAQKVLCR